MAYLTQRACGLTDVWVNIMNMSPSGKLLAVAGGGLQVFHFNGASLIAKYSKVLTADPIDKIRWDNNNQQTSVIGSPGKTDAEEVEQATVI